MLEIFNKTRGAQSSAMLQELYLVHMPKATLMREKQCTESFKGQHDETHLKSHMCLMQIYVGPVNGLLRAMHQSCRRMKICSPSLLRLYWPVACALGSALAYL